MLVYHKEALQKIQRLYNVEKESKTWTDEKRLEYRKENSKPILEDFLVWLKNHKSKVLPKSKLGEAITYCLNQWNQLVVCLHDGQIDIDNNRAERSIKPFVISRKNWLFANSLKGTESSAIILSVVETAKANGLNPLYYLTYLFEQLPQVDLADPEAWEEVLPWSSSLPEICHVPKK
ncbi:IS66 family transposase [Halobacillus seohaensis]|uniref:Transposase n=1 Tax=Halobacillus seohaensis TaxID=447421 RepID=A0ABW2EMN6_9BACI